MRSFVYKPDEETNRVHSRVPPDRLAEDFAVDFQPDSQSARGEQTPRLSGRTKDQGPVVCLICAVEERIGTTKGPGACVNDFDPRHELRSHPAPLQGYTARPQAAGRA